YPCGYQLPELLYLSTSKSTRIRYGYLVTIRTSIILARLTQSSLTHDVTYNMLNNISNIRMFWL
ncbi:uncharacterized protein BDW70DRAFT_144938, partial [Aspergillus foveolatus]|uniref:uncharacterized protein n=1 Tax=Aspergillus foveolatus TaxID=210207 RepID=UPI003CCD1972